MSDLAVKLAINAVHTWSRIYTVGLAEPIGNSRMLEVDSDLWEHAADAMRNGASRRGLAAHMFVRLILGAPADLSWRLSAATDGAYKADRNVPRMKIRAARWRFLGIGALLTALSLGATASSTLAFPLTLNELRPFVASIVLLLNGTALAAVIWVVCRRPMSATPLVASAAATFAMLWYWTWLGPVLALAWCFFGLVLARSLRGPSSRSNIH